jgi:hypothetical protein
MIVFEGRWVLQEINRCARQHSLPEIASFPVLICADVEFLGCRFDGQRCIEIENIRLQINCAHLLMCL